MVLDASPDSDVRWGETVRKGKESESFKQFLGVKIVGCTPVELVSSVGMKNCSISS